MNEYKDTRAAVMGLLAELAKTTTDPNTARQLKTSRSIHMLANSCAVSSEWARGSNVAGFKRGKNRDLWLASHEAA